MSKEQLQLILTKPSSLQPMSPHPSLSSGRRPGSYLCLSFSQPPHPIPQQIPWDLFSKQSQSSHLLSALMPLPGSILSHQDYYYNLLLGPFLLPHSPTINIPNTAAEGILVSVSSCYSSAQNPQMAPLSLRLKPSLAARSYYNLPPVTSLISYLSSHTGLLTIPLTYQAHSYLRAFACAIPGA